MAKITVSIGLNLPVTDDEKGRFNRITPSITTPPTRKPPTTTCVRNTRKW